MTDTTVEIRLLGLPVDLHLMQIEHVDGLVREFGWLSDDPSDTPARILDMGRRIRRRSSAVMAPLLALVIDAHRRGDATIDLAFPVPVEAADTCRTTAALLDEADEFCRTGGMLTLATPPPAAAYRRWFLEEIIRQIEGEPPRPWSPSDEATEVEARRG